MLRTALGHARIVHHQDLEFGRQKGQVVAGPGHFGGQGANSEVEDFSCDPSMTERCEECRIASRMPWNDSWSATVLTEERLLTRWVGGWAEHTRGGARMERLGAVVAIVVMETLDPGSNSAFTRHGIDAQRRCVLQRHARVSAVWWARRRRPRAYAWRILKRLGAKTPAPCPFEKVNSELNSEQWSTLVRAKPTFWEVRSTSGPGAKTHAPCPLKK